MADTPDSLPPLMREAIEYINKIHSMSPEEVDSELERWTRVYKSIRDIEGPTYLKVCALEGAKAMYDMGLRVEVGKND